MNTASWNGQLWVSSPSGFVPLFAAPELREMLTREPLPWWRRALAWCGRLILRTLGQHR